MNGRCVYCGDPVEPPDVTGLTRESVARALAATRAAGVAACLSHADLARLDPSRDPYVHGRALPWELRALRVIA